MRRITWILIMLLVVVSGCAPRISPKDYKDIPSNPFPEKRPYKDPIEKLREIMPNSGEPKVFMVMPAPNKTGDQGLPSDITEMLVSSLDLAAGDRIKQFKYDPEQLLRLLEIYRLPIKLPTPDVLIGGAILISNPNVSVIDGRTETGIYIPLVLEQKIGDGDVTLQPSLDTDIRVAWEKTRSVWQITMELYLMDPISQTYLPQIRVSNSILTCTLEKGKTWTFMIAGSGFSKFGKISEKQGPQQALRNLMDYSVAELLAKYYELPWQGVAKSNPLNEKIRSIQFLLSQCPLGTVYLNGALVQQIPDSETGKFGKVTQLFTLRFLYQYAPESELIMLVENNLLPQRDEKLNELYKVLQTTGLKRAPRQ
jgi:hypothetical protein